MAASRGVGIFFRQFLLQKGNSQMNKTAIPLAFYTTNKEEITSNPFFEKYAEKIKSAHGNQRCVSALLK